MPKFLGFDFYSLSSMAAFRQSMATIAEDTEDSGGGDQHIQPVIASEGPAMGAITAVTAAALTVADQPIGDLMCGRDLGGQTAREVLDETADQLNDDSVVVVADTQLSRNNKRKRSVTFGEPIERHIECRSAADDSRGQRDQQLMNRSEEVVPKNFGAQAEEVSDETTAKSPLNLAANEEQMDDNSSDGRIDANKRIRVAEDTDQWVTKHMKYFEPKRAKLGTTLRRPPETPFPINCGTNLGPNNTANTSRAANQSGAKRLSQLSDNIVLNYLANRRREPSMRSSVPLIGRQMPFRRTPLRPNAGNISLTADLPPLTVAATFGVTSRASALNANEPIVGHNATQTAGNPRTGRRNPFTSSNELRFLENRLVEWQNSLYGSRTSHPTARHSTTPFGGIVMGAHRPPAATQSAPTLTDEISFFNIFTKNQ